MPKSKSHRNTRTLLPLVSVTTGLPVKLPRKYYKVLTWTLNPIHGNPYKYNISGLNNDFRTTRKVEPELCVAGLHATSGHDLERWMKLSGYRVFEVKPGGRIDTRDLLGKIAADQLLFVGELTQRRIKNIIYKHRWTGTF